MKMHIKSVMVDDQAKAHKFYTEVFGFKTKHNLEFGKHRWLTLVSPEDEHGVELAREPNEYTPLLSATWSIFVGKHAA